jgi:hypothetical protein
VQIAVWVVLDEEGLTVDLGVSHNFTGNNHVSQLETSGSLLAGRPMSGNGDTVRPGRCHRVIGVIGISTPSTFYAAMSMG